MLKSWSIKNFKPIVDSGELHIAPVTVLAGRNSSGKSSLLQSILMIAQTLGSRLLDRPLLPNERLVQLGTFESILSDFAPLRKLELGFEVEFEEEEKVWYDSDGVPWPDYGPYAQSARITLTFEERNKQSTSFSSAIAASQVSLEHVSIHILPEQAFDNVYPHLIVIPLHYREVTEVDFLFQRIDERKFDEIVQKMPVESRRGLAHNTEHMYYRGAFSNSETYVVTLSHFLPASLIRERSDQEAFAREEKAYLLDVFSQQGGKIDFEFYGDIIISEEAQNRINELLQQNAFKHDFDGNTLLDVISYVDKEYPEKIMEKIVDIIIEDTILKKDTLSLPRYEDQKQAIVMRATNRITYFFTNQIRYLGPLRVDPGTIQQQFAPTGDLDYVGVKGEYAAIVYHTNKNALIDWYNPHTQQIENGSLQLALDTWTHYLNIAEQIGTEEAGAVGITWRIVPQKGSKPRLLPEVGVGISQILPILVMGLLSPANTLLIIEQPELHLHPYVQARLGDFFMGLAKCKKQCLIETHSENLVSQLRLHIVQAGGLEKSDCMIYFVDQDEQGAAKFEKVEISPNGNILNWPDGFFDETMLQEDRITAASLRKRAREAKHGS